MVLGVIAIALILALTLIARRAATPRWFFAISLLPLLLTVIVPLPFSMTAQGPTPSLRAKLLGISRAGIVLSLVISAIGALLLLQALRRGDRQTIVVLGLETALAAFPAVVFAVAYLVFR